MYRWISALALVFATPLAAQTHNCTLLGTQNLHPGYANIWGYVAPNGHEYALLGCNSGTSIVDVTVPTAPVERGFIPGNNSSWRELNTYRQYCYVSTESGGAGIQVIDLTNPDAPVLANTFGTAQFNNCHTITCDTQTGRIYCNGTNNGTAVYDASVTPVTPTFVGYMTPAGQSNYFHDFHTRNGYGYASMIYNGQLRIYDLSTFPGTVLSSTTTPRSFTHNAWTNASSTLCVTTDEKGGALVKFYDITNRSAPVPLGSYTTNSDTIPHNAYIIGNLCHVSWYTEGYVLLDISDPNNPVEIASYDTWPGVSAGYEGAWGCYPFLPSGNILLSDISTGLYIVRPVLSDLRLTHTPLPGNTQNEIGPYAVRATVTGSNPLSQAELQYRVNGGAFSTVAMTPTGNPDEYGADIPGQLAFANVEYHISVGDGVVTRRSPISDEHRFVVGTVTSLWFDDAEINRGWTHGATAGTDDWQRGTPNGKSGVSGVFSWTDPWTAYSGTGAWGTDLGASTANGSYPNSYAVWFQSPAIATTGLQGLHVRYRRWLTLQTSDTARLLVNGNVVFTTNTATHDPTWLLIDHDVSAITNAASTVTLRFELTTNSTNVAGGWNLDDIEIYKPSDCVVATFYGAGTAGTGGIIPALARSGDPHTGTTFQVNGSNLLGGAGCILALGFASASVPTFGITLLVDPANAGYLFNVANGTVGAPGAGSASWSFTVPNNVNLDNLALYNQVAVFDAGSLGGVFSASNGMRSAVCIH